MYYTSCVICLESNRSPWKTNKTPCDSRVNPFTEASAFIQRRLHEKVRRKRYGMYAVVAGYVLKASAASRELRTVGLIEYSFNMALDSSLAFKLAISNMDTITTQA